MKKVTILFGDAHLSYSPTVIGLYDLLSRQFDVTIVARSPESFDNKPLPDRRVVYIKEKPSDGRRRYLSRARFEALALLRGDVAQLKQAGVHHSHLAGFEFVRDYLNSEKPDLVIAVDFKNLFFAQVLGRRVEFLSLEIRENDIFYNSCLKRGFDNIDSVIIQTRERYRHLFDDRDLPVYFIQNAPVYIASPTVNERQGLVYAGTAWDPFGFYHILEFLNAYPEYDLTLKGALLHDDRARVNDEYQALISTGRLTIDDDYLDQREIVEYLRRFRAGFCFYNFDIDWVNTFNYRSAPSGKMFNYMAAGVPVIGIDVPGLGPVKEFDCGVLIADLKPASIKRAVEQTLSDHQRYSKNCLTAAEHYSFDRAAAPFIGYVSNKLN